MEPRKSRWEQSAGALALFPILGLLGGILVNVLRANLGADPFASVELIAQGGFLGSVFGVAVAVLCGRSGAEELSIAQEDDGPRLRGRRGACGCRHTLARPGFQRRDLGRALASFFLATGRRQSAGTLIKS